MLIQYLTKQQAASAMKEWRESGKGLPKVDHDYEVIRGKIEKLYENTTCENNYKADTALGLELYKYFSELDFFSLRIAANDDFWRYLSVKVVPHIVAKRWGDENDDHFWKKNVRIWLRSIWWYVHLSWRGSIEDTKDILTSPNFSTDSILNLVERSGRRGTFIEVYRYIMYFYSNIPQEKLNQFNNSTQKHDDLFRIVMKLNTARTLVIDPALYLGGEQEYVKSLFAEAGCPV